MKYQRIYIFFLGVLIITTLIILPFLLFPNVLKPISDLIFEGNLGNNGRFLKVILSSFTSVAIVFGVVFGYHQIWHMSENNIHEKYKTAIKHYRSKKIEISYCGTTMLHKIAKRSEDFRENIKHLFIDKVNYESISPESPDKISCIKLLFSENDIYGSDSDNEHYHILENMKLKDFSLAKSTIRNYYFNNCTFDSTILDNTIFSNCKFNNTIFINAGLEDVKFRKCFFDTTKFIGAGKDAVRLHRIEFYQCVVKSSEFNYFEAKGANFSGVSRFRDVCFANGGITMSSFKNSTFTNCKFINCDLEKVNYEKARIKKCDFSQAINLYPYQLNTSSTLVDSNFPPHIRSQIKKELLENHYLFSGHDCDE